MKADNALGNNTTTNDNTFIKVETLDVGRWTVAVGENVRVVGVPTIGGNHFPPYSAGKYPKSFSR